MFSDRKTHVKQKSKGSTSAERSCPKVYASEFRNFLQSFPQFPTKFPTLNCPQKPKTISPTSSWKIAEWAGQPTSETTICYTGSSPPHCAPVKKFTSNSSTQKWGQIKMGQIIHIALLHGHLDDILSGMLFADITKDIATEVSQ